MFLKPIIPTFDFSFVIPTRNNLDELARSLLSISNEAPNKSEVIVVDGSDIAIGEDKIYKLSSIGKVNVRYILENKKGVFSAINDGIIESRGKWIIVLTAGDYFVDGACELLSKIENSQKDAIVFAQNVVDQRNKLQYSFYPTLDSVWPHQSMVLKRKIHEQIGLYPTEYRHVSEHYLIKRVKEVANVELIPDVLSVFCLGGISSGASNAQAKERYQLSRDLGNGILYSFIKAYFLPNIRYYIENNKVLNPLATLLRKLFFDYYKTPQNQ
jgi:glycosyltransferase involved in cell wall biosynthesis